MAGVVWENGWRWIFILVCSQLSRIFFSHMIAGVHFNKLFFHGSIIRKALLR